MSSEMCSFSFSSSSSSSISLSFSPKSEALTSLLAPAACFESSCHLKSSLRGFKIPLGSQDSVIAAGLESFPVAEPLILRMLKGSGKRGIVASPFRCFFGDLTLILSEGHLEIVNLPRSWPGSDYVQGVPMQT